MNSHKVTFVFERGQFADVVSATVTAPTRASAVQQAKRLCSEEIRNVRDSFRGECNIRINVRTYKEMAV